MRWLWISCLACLFICAVSNDVYGQDYATSSAGGEWTDDSYWGGSAPPYTGVTPDVYINHRIFSNSSIVFADAGSNKDHLYVNDTLIIYGSLTLGSHDDVTIGANGLLLIFGDFTSQNQVNIANGGYLIVLGDFYLPQGGTSFGNIDTARTYIVGDVDIPNNGADDLDCDPDVDTDCGYGDGSDLFEDPIFDFIEEISDQTCSITLTAVITDESSVGAADGAIDVSLSGATSPSYSWSNDSITQDISGLSAGDFGLVVFDGVCVIDTFLTVSTPCTAPAITGTTPAARCGAGTVGLSAVASAGTIEWYNVAAGGSSLGTGASFTTPSISVTTSYYVDATDGGCTTASRTEIVATIHSLPLVTIIGNDSTCTGNVVTLDAGAGYTSYLWNTAETTQTINITAPVLTDPNTEEVHSWSVAVTDSNTCQGNGIFDMRVFRVPVTGPQFHIDDTYSD